MTDQRPSGEREWEITTNTYIFAGVGALILGVLAYLSLGGIPNTIAAAVVGGLAGGALGLFFLGEHELTRQIQGRSLRA